MSLPLRGLLRLRLEGGRFVAAVREEHVQPTGRHVRITGPDAIRILLFGGDYANGYNVRNRHDALDGAIANLVHERTGRGVYVENRSSPDVPLDSLTDSLGGSAAHTFHIAVWCPTFNEAARRPFARSWRRALIDLITHVRSTSNTSLLLLTIPTLTGPQPFAALARSQAALINTAIRSAAATDPRTRATTTPSIPFARIQELDGAATYREAAEALLPDLLHLANLDTSDNNDGRRVTAGMPPGQHRGTGPCSRMLQGS